MQLTFGDAEGLGKCRQANEGYTFRHQVKWMRPYGSAVVSFFPGASGMGCLVEAPQTHLADAQADSHGAVAICEVRFLARPDVQAIGLLTV